MLVKPPLEELLPKTENRYTLAILTAKRTRQLVAGGKVFVDSKSPNLVTMACEEIAAGSVVEVQDVVEPVIPLRPEVEAARQAAQVESEEEHNLDSLRSSIGAVMQEEEEKEVVAESFIKIMTKENGVMSALEYFGDGEADSSYEDDDDEEAIIATDLFSDEAEEADLDGEYIDDDVAAEDEAAIVEEIVANAEEESEEEV